VSLSETNADAVVVDACCLINLAAANALNTWLGDLGLRWMLPEAVLGEALFLRCPRDDAAERGDSPQTDTVREPILLQPQITHRLLTVVRPASDAELAVYVAFARELDDGEAMALAIAQARGWLIATDDHKAIRLAGEAGVPVLTTPAVMRRWADELGPSDAEISAALLAIRERARFLPGGRDPLSEWWIKQLRA